MLATPSPLAHDLARRSLHLMQEWDESEATAIVHPQCVNREAEQEPPDARGRGPEALRATHDWLHAAYQDLVWEVQDIVSENDLVVAHVIMGGRQVGPFAVYGTDGRVERAFAATGREFAVTQTHWFRIVDGQVFEHWANRDDMGEAVQLGWVPPSPAFLWRSAADRRRLRRSARVEKSRSEKSRSEKSRSEKGKAPAHRNARAHLG